MRWSIVLVAMVVSVPAWAQSTRYPPEPVDKDEEAAHRSKLWESATNPQRTPYGKLMFEAEQALREPGTVSTQGAVKKLDEAIALMPDEPRAYRLRGDANMTLKDWGRCATDFAGAWTRAARDTLDARQLTELRRKLGLCQARAGKLAEAERTLAEAAVTGNATGEIWMRLGEVRIAMGKLEEAIAALESAAEQSDAPAAMIRWLLAGAYDRARKPAESIDNARKATALDRSFSTLKNEQLPLLGIGEAEYLQGLAYAAYEQPRPDYSLVYFRYFLKVAKDSPWRKRAEEHVKELKLAELPEVIEKRGGNAAFDPAVGRVPVRRMMPAMRACVTKTPFIIYEVVITKAGPRTPQASRDRPRYFAPPETVNVTPVIGPPAWGEVTQAERDTVVRCIEPIASKIGFAAIKDKDTYFRVSFTVIAP